MTGRCRSALLGWMLLGCSTLAQAGSEIEILAPWSRAVPPVSKVGAAYLTLRNRGDAPDRLESAASPAAARVEIHGHEEKDGMMRMYRVEGVDLAPGAQVVLAPGGMHLMLMGLIRPLIEGQTFEVTLRFAEGGEVTVAVPVRAAGSRAPEGN